MPISSGVVIVSTLGPRVNVTLDVNKAPGGSPLRWAQQLLAEATDHRLDLVVVQVDGVDA